MQNWLVILWAGKCYATLLIISGACMFILVVLRIFLGLSTGSALFGTSGWLTNRSWFPPLHVNLMETFFKIFIIRLGFGPVISETLSYFKTQNSCGHLHHGVPGSLERFSLFMLQHITGRVELSITFSFIPKLGDYQRDACFS